MKKFLLTLGAIGISLCGPGIWAQDGVDQDGLDSNPSILSLLPSQGQAVVDGTVTGRLTERDFLVRAGRRVAAWDLAVDGVGTEFLIDLEAIDFDSYLYIVGPRIRMALGEFADESYALTDDDGGEGLNSRLCFLAPMEDTYQVVVGALYAETGEYSLSVTRGCEGEDVWPEGSSEEEGSAIASVDPWGVRVAGSLRAGEIRGGVLSPATVVEAWTLSADRTQRFHVSVTSEEIVPEMAIVSADGRVGGTVRAGADWADARPDAAGPDWLIWTTESCVLAGQEEAFRVLVRGVGALEGESDGGGFGAYAITVSADPEGVRCPAGSVDVVSAAHYFELLSELPDQGRRVGVGETREGLFTSVEEMDPKFGHPVQAWTVAGTSAGEWVTIDLRSQMFNPRLLMLLEEGDSLESRYGDCGHRANVRPSASGIISVIVTREATGEFTLSAFPGKEALERMECPIEDTDEGTTEVQTDAIQTDTRVLVIGSEVTSRLVGGTDDRATWLMELAARDRVVVAVESDDIDTYLEIYGPGLVGGLWDDDGGPGTNSRVILEAVEGGEYEIVVSAFTGRGSGEFRLRATRALVW